MEKNNFMKSMKEENIKGNMDRLPVVLVTGFGPFRNHSENASWLTVKELLNLNIPDFTIVAKELPVEYEAVSRVVPELWQKHNPKLVVHCGLAESAKCLHLEKVAYNDNYKVADVKGQLPPCCVVIQNGPEKLNTAIDIDSVLEDLASSDVCVKAVPSENAGRFVCEFTFYTSLRVNRNAAFVHVPPINQPYSARAMAQALAIIISSMLKQIKNS